MPKHDNFLLNKNINFPYSSFFDPGVQPIKSPTEKSFFFYIIFYFGFDRFAKNGLF